MREQDIQDKIRAELSAQTEGLVFRTNAGSAWGGDKLIDTPEYGRVLLNPRKILLLPEGFSDLLYIGPDGKVAFIECKTPRGRLREEQERFLAIMQRMGHSAGVARSVEDALAIVKSSQK